MNKEVEELNTQLDNRLQSEDTRARIIDVVCDSDKVNAKIKELCDERIESFNKDLIIDEYAKHIKNWKYWIPIGSVAVIGIANIAVTLAAK